MLLIIFMMLCAISINFLMSASNYVEQDAYYGDDNNETTEAIMEEGPYEETLPPPDYVGGYEDGLETVSEYEDGDDTPLDEFGLTRTLLNGTDNEVRELKVAQVLESLAAIDKIQMSLNKKLIVWNMIKTNRSANALKRDDLENGRKLVLHMPEIDLYNLNYTDWDITDYLGSLPGLTRRRTGIIGYALKQTWGNDIIYNMIYVNRMKGILCAFSPRELWTISPMKFCEISEEVFKNIRSCTNRQLRVLMNTARRTPVYGPIQSWNSTTVATLGLLIKSLAAEELTLIRPEAMEGINYATIEAMSKENLSIFNGEQISFLSDLSLAVYRRLTGIDSNVGNCCRRYTHISRTECCFQVLCCVNLILLLN